MDKKVLAVCILVFAIIALGLSGCGKKEPVNDSQPPETDSPPEVVKPDETEKPAEKKTADPEAVKGVVKSLDPNTTSKLAQILASEKHKYTQFVCPIEGNKIDNEIFVDYGGKKVYFCCEGCKGKFDADPKTYIPKLPQFKK